LTEVKGGSVEAIYHWHPHYVDALGVRMRASDTHFFLQDANFNVTAAVNDDGNAVVERYAYTPYGEPTILDADFTADSVNDDGYSDIDNRHLYTGREFDWDSGLQLNRHRYYASHLGRWLTRDPIGYEEQNNLYNYAGSSPISHLDASGEAYQGSDRERERIRDKVGALNSYAVWRCYQRALRDTATEPGRSGGKGDALRHCIWLCCMAELLNSNLAEAVGEIHEEEAPPNPPPGTIGPPIGWGSIDDWKDDDSAMDRHNNAIGNGIGSNCPNNCTEDCKKALEDGRLIVNDDDGYDWVWR
jgi:RHS repeat-associated protein